MKLFSVIRAFGPLLVVTCSIILGLITSSGAQLAAYSETRSFRDALDGRSMEEAISGPVDKDTSSYGDRTADSSASSSSANGGASAGSSNGGAVAQTMLNIPANGNLNQQQQVQVPAGEEQQKSAAPASSDGGELEREAGPISPNFPMDTQQKMMEQSGTNGALNGNGRMQQQQQPMRSRGNNGRLMASSMMKMAQASKRMGRPQKLQQQQEKSGQAQDTFAAGTSESFGDEMSSGAAAKKTRMGQNGNKYPAGGRSAAPAPGSAGPSSDYGAEPSAASNGNEIDGGQQRMNGGDDYNQATTPAGGDEQQQMMNSPGQQQQQEKGFDNGDRQQQMLPARQRAPGLANGQMMNMDDNKMMNRLRSGAGAYSTPAMTPQMGVSGRLAKQQQPSGMAQSMMMSLANKAAYMANQQRQQQQVAQMELASPAAMMMPMNGYGAVLPMSSNGNGNGNGNSRFAAASAGSYGNNANEQQQQQQMQTAVPMKGPMGATSNYQMPAAAAAASAMLMMNGNGASVGSSRPMRRANQRKVEKKLSPAMMNAMLNKMLASQQENNNGSSSPMGQYANGNGNGNYNNKPTATSAMMMENLMKTPMGAEMLANMMMMNSNGAATMSASKRDQYKRMLMNAIMQQQQPQMSAGEDDGSYGQGAEQQGPLAGGNNNNNKYGERSVARSPMMTMNGNGNKNGNRMSPSSSSSYQQRPMMSQAMAGSDRPSYGSAGMGNTAMPAAMAASANGQGNSMGEPANGAYDGQQEQQKENVDSQRAGRKTMAPQQQQQQMDDSQLQQKDMSMGTDDTKGGSGPSMARGSMKPMMSAAGLSYGQQAMRRKVAGQGSYGNRDSMPSKPSAMQAMQNMMMSMNKMAGNGEQKQLMYGSGMGMVQQQQQQQQQEQQRQEMVDMMGDMNDKSMGATDAPMNGFRQAYSPGQQQQQQQQMPDVDSRGSNGDNYSQTQQQQRETDHGTKSAEGAKPMAAAPMARPMSMSYGSDKGDDQMEQQQQQEDGYGAAPMGQAEPFAFNYKTQDNYGNEQYRKEESDRNGVVRGSYGYMDTSGIFRHVEYVADENGFRANVKSNEPGLGAEQAGEPGANRGTVATPPPASNEQPLDSVGMNEQPAAGPAGLPVPPPSSSSSLGGSSGTGDASLRLQQQPEQQQQQLDTAQLPMVPLMAMNNANGAMMQAMNSQQKADRELQQQRQTSSAAYGAGMQAAQMNTDSDALAAKSA